ncbi:ribosome biogenesis GTP-binding protein YihA/YsxC [Desulfogranum mediterraneum]|uniref:ribosome biogenesis GTP-binding protein YihA/YsxC n=1 Tax=Desulfogranum mediterraneum TaxID=160661 RepID=UPI0004252F3C|nr:ribosome biogenesis GTP-binding protein YihA/YsxC [Desulfogranum mediterraneum]
MSQPLNLQKVEFLLSAFSSKQLPDEIYPEIAFAGRSNVGKSSLMNRVLGRSNLVKTSSKPGKTQSLNYFSVDERLYLVDLPGYGFARVSKKVRNQWQDLISSYLENRERLALVVVIVDLRHEAKELDRELINWLRYHRRPYHLVYTKADKLTRNRQNQHAAALDRGLEIQADQRLIFSAKTGQGVDGVRQLLFDYLHQG